MNHFYPQGRLEIKYHWTVNTPPLGFHWSKTKKIIILDYFMSLYPLFGNQRRYSSCLSILMLIGTPSVWKKNKKYFSYHNLQLNYLNLNLQKVISKNLPNFLNNNFTNWWKNLILYFKTMCSVLNNSYLNYRGRIFNICFLKILIFPLRKKKSKIFVSPWFSSFTKEVYGSHVFFLGVGLCN